MKHNLIHSTRFFFATAPLPCPYLPDRVERRVVTELTGVDTAAQHNALSLAGYRRSHDIAYAPACPDCSACIAVRIDAKRFKPSRSQRRVQSINSDVAVVESSPSATVEQFELFTAYQNSRHAEGEMAKMDFNDYCALVEETPVETSMAEFRDPDRRLVGACLVDKLDDGLSAVYSFYDPALDRRSLGTLMILWLARRTRQLDLTHAYLGFLIAGCSKMSYKGRFQPLEAYTPEGWRPFSAAEAEVNGTPAGNQP